MAMNKSNRKITEGNEREKEMEGPRRMESFLGEEIQIIPLAHGEADPTDRVLGGVSVRGSGKDASEQERERKKERRDGLHFVGSLTAVIEDTIEKGEGFQKKLATLPPQRRLIKMRPRAASTGTPVVHFKGERRKVSTTLEDGMSKEETSGKSQHASPKICARACRTVIGEGDQDFQVKTNVKKRRKKKKKEGKVKDEKKEVGKTEEDKAVRRPPEVRTSEAIRLIAKGGETFSGILRTVKFKVDPAETRIFQKSCIPVFEADEAE